MYHQIWMHHGIQSGKCLIDNNFIFQQGNDLKKHTANGIKAYLDRLPSVKN